MSAVEDEDLVNRAERLAAEERLLVGQESEKAIDEETRAAAGGAHSLFHRQAAEVHRLAAKVHMEAAMLHQRHVEHLRQLRSEESAKDSPG